MKFRKPLLIAIILIGTIFLSSCSGGVTNTSWPGMNVNGDNLYLSYQTALYAIRMTDGIQIWKYPAEGRSTATFYAPAIATADQLIVGDYQNTLHSFDPAAGTSKWTFTEAQGRYIGSVLVNGDHIYAPVSNSNLYALSTAGQKQWVFEDSTQALWAQPVTDGNLIFQASMDHNIYAVNAETGEQAWNLKLDGAIVNTPLLDNGVLYTNTLAGSFYAINTSNQQIVWQTKIDEDGWGSPVMKDGTLYLADLSGKIYAVNSADGSQVWTLDAGGPVVGSGGLISEGIVFVTENGNVILVSFDGVKTWTRSIEGKLYGTPAIGDDRIVVSVVGGENLLVAYDFKGNEIWKFVPASKGK